MYESFYGLNGKPFSLLPDPNFLFLSKKHSIALSLLEYSLTEQAGITVLTGEIGCGKTTLVKHLLGEQQHTSNIAYIYNTHESMGEIMPWILNAFSIASSASGKVEMFNDFNRYLQKNYAQGKKSILIVDEAQNLTMESLEELRLLSNVNIGMQQLLQLILVGQPELSQTLRNKKLEQFSQRVTMDYFITPLDLQEIKQYIEHRLKVVDGNPKLFSSEAIGVIAYYSRGVPRLINIICDMALIYGFAEQEAQISVDTIREVVNDRLRMQILPLQKTKPRIRMAAGTV